MNNIFTNPALNPYPPKFKNPRLCALMPVQRDFLAWVLHTQKNALLESSVHIITDTLRCDNYRNTKRERSILNEFRNVFQDEYKTHQDTLQNMSVDFGRGNSTSTKSEIEFEPVTHKFHKFHKW